MGSSKLLSLALCFVASADNANLRGAAQADGDANFTDMTFETIDAHLTNCGEAVLDFTEEDSCHGRNADLADVVDAAEMCRSTCQELSFRMLGACTVNSSVIELPEKLPAALGAKPLVQTSLHQLLESATSALASCNPTAADSKLASLSLPVASFSKAQIVVGLRGSKWQRSRDTSKHLNSWSGIVIGLRGRKWDTQPDYSQNLNAFTQSFIIVGLRGSKWRHRGENSRLTNIASSSEALELLATSQILVGGLQ
eukprot:TRINITY_DN35951_c0_g1_i1.p1 TRINITY_DN35951_c0_g1~~TRINITY_DN35951_c0_g1_i1.p1  ORF type:complete len:254 (+),score=31.47 TRINITY_DN35951_c0_g1_i1:56-817(+)